MPRLEREQEPHGLDRELLPSGFHAWLADLVNRAAGWVEVEALHRRLRGVEFMQNSWASAIVTPCLSAKWRNWRRRAENRRSLPCSAPAAQRRFSMRVSIGGPLATSEE